MRFWNWLPVSNERQHDRMLAAANLVHFVHDLRSENTFEKFKCRSLKMCLSKD